MRRDGRRASARTWPSARTALAEPAARLPFEPLDDVPDDPRLWSEVPLELLVRYSCVPAAPRGRADRPRLRRPRGPAAGRRARVPAGAADRGGGRARGPGGRRCSGATAAARSSSSRRARACACSSWPTTRREAVDARALPAREPDRAPRRLADPRRHRAARLRHPRRDEGPRGARQVPDRRRALPRPRAARQAAPRHDPQPAQGHVGARHRREARAPGRPLPPAGEGPHHRLPRLDHAVDPRRGRGHPHPRQGVAQRRLPQPAPRRARLLRGRPAQAAQVHHRALRHGRGHRAHRQRQDHDALRRAQRDRDPRGQDHHHRGPGRVPDPRRSPRCR